MASRRATTSNMDRKVIGKRMIPYDFEIRYEKSFSYKDLFGSKAIDTRVLILKRLIIFLIHSFLLQETMKLSEGSIKL